MSFSADVKKELTAVEGFPCCESAENYAILLFGRSFGATEISLLTENQAVAQCYTNAITFFGGVSPEIQVSDSGNKKICLTDIKTISNIAQKLGYKTGGIKRKINFEILNNSCCKNAFLRGAFLSCGTLTDPEKEYHLEFTVSTRGLCLDLSRLLTELGVTPKITVRSGTNIIYFKSSSEIEDILSLMGATENAMEIMGAKMLKDIRNNVNRKVNFENANMKRSIAAAKKQYDAIEIIRKKIGLDNLPDDLKELAVLRIENREDSNAEIAAMLSAPLTLSGLNHRFRRLMSIAEELKNKPDRKEL